jgi:hypothetical protein
MNPRRLAAAALTLTAVLLLAAAPPADPNAALRAGDDAFARGDYAAAVTFYGQAEARTTEPGLVAYDLAAAKYRLALATDENGDRARLLQEAERHYRCCVEPGDPRRARALYGLGNCLLLQAEGRDAAGVRAAVAAYDDCLAEPDLDAGLAADARHNRERARLLAQQLTPPTKPQDQPSQGDDQKPPDPKKPPDKPERNPTPQPGTDKVKPDDKGKPAQAEQGDKPIETDAPPPPGEGNLPPVPDRTDAPPLSREDAAAHLEQAAKRIVEEARAHRRAGVRPPPAGVKDW